MALHKEGTETITQAQAALAIAYMQGRVAADVIGPHLPYNIFGRNCEMYVWQVFEAAGLPDLGPICPNMNMPVHPRRIAATLLHDAIEAWLATHH